MRSFRVSYLVFVAVLLWSTSTLRGQTAPELGVSLGSSSNVLLTIYGTAGSNYTLLSATNLAAPSPWRNAGSFSLTDTFQVINIPTTNQMQLFKAVQPETQVFSSNAAPASMTWRRSFSVGE